MMAVLPSPDSATEEPCWAWPAAPVPINFTCSLHTPPLRVKTHVAPSLLLSFRPPMRAVLPSADSATEKPCWAAPTLLLPTSLGPCWLHVPPLRAKIH